MLACIARLFFDVTFQHFPRTIARIAIRTYIPASAWRKYAARGSLSKSGEISKTRGNGCMTTIRRLANRIRCGVTTKWPQACNKLIQLSFELLNISHFTWFYKPDHILVVWQTAPFGYASCIIHPFPGVHPQVNWSSSKSSKNNRMSFKNPWNVFLKIEVDLIYLRNSLRPNVVHNLIGHS